MPLVTLTGVPCVGKSTFAKFLANFLNKNGLDTEIISEDALNLGRVEMYGSSAKEKVRCCAPPSCPHTP